MWAGRTLQLSVGLMHSGTACSPCPATLIVTRAGNNYGKTVANGSQAVVAVGLGSGQCTQATENFLLPKMAHQQRVNIAKADELLSVHNRER